MKEILKYPENTIIKMQRIKFHEHLDYLQPNRFNSQTHHKIIELCQTQKFLETIDSEAYVEQLYESPDFIINYKGKRIGLEHEILLDSKQKSIEGFFEGLCLKVEERFYNEKYPDTFLAGVYFNKDFIFSNNNKSKYLDQIYYKISNIRNTNMFDPNEMITDIRISKHSQINIYANFGGYGQNILNKDIIFNAIEKKEKLIESYHNNTKLKQWLLIVLTATNDSSYSFEEDFTIDYKSEFERVFILEDLSGKLYEI